MIDIEPEKEIVIIISKTKDARPIIDAVNKALALDEPGNGILFVQDIGEVYGLAK